MFQLKNYLLLLIVLKFGKNRILRLITMTINTKALLSTPLLREELFGLLALEDLLRCTIESRIYPSLHTGDHFYLS